MLLPPVQDSLFEEHGDKKNSVAALKAKPSKIIFVMLDEVVTIHI